MLASSEFGIAEQTLPLEPQDVQTATNGNGKARRQRHEQKAEEPAVKHGESGEAVLFGSGQFTVI